MSNVQSNWQVVPIANGNYAITLTDVGEIGKITHVAGKWQVKFLRLVGYDFAWFGKRDDKETFGVCVGYMRGIERAVANKAIKL